MHRVASAHFSIHQLYEMMFKKSEQRNTRIVNEPIIFSNHNHNNNSRRETNRRKIIRN